MAQPTHLTSRKASPLSIGWTPAISLTPHRPL
eukprot:SAG11_NODE_27291_length_334_cov_0.948936_1_plen_31_part_01